MASSAVRIAYEIEADIIIVLTEFGRATRYISKYKPSVPILSITYSPKTASMLKMLRGNISFLIKKSDNESYTKEELF